MQDESIRVAFSLLLISFYLLLFTSQSFIAILLLLITFYSLILFTLYLLRFTSFVTLYLLLAISYSLLVTFNLCYMLQFISAEFDFSHFFELAI